MGRQVKLVGACNKEHFANKEEMAEKEEIPGVVLSENNFSLDFTYYFSNGPKNISRNCPHLFLCSVLHTGFGPPGRGDNE